MKRYQITQRQMDNLHEALKMWDTIPEQNVAYKLGYWRSGGPSLPPRYTEPTCGTVACFGGWCAWWPAFREQGVRANDSGAPQICNDKGTEVAGYDVARVLFGHSTLFVPIGAFLMFDEDDNVIIEDSEFENDHAVLRHRLEYVINNSEVIA